MKTGLCFDDVLLQPKYSEIESRSEIDIGNIFQEGADTFYRLELPIISAPMDTVTESEMVHAMTALGGAAIIHRYNTIEEQLSILDASWPVAAPVGVAVGVQGDYLERAVAACAAGAKIICVDVAHGHHILMKNALKNLKEKLPGWAHVMAGNVATAQAFKDLGNWGADSVKVGIGGGSICSTRIQTGHGVPTFQSIMDCRGAHPTAKLIADGGIKNSGDIVKALAAGADFVMLGSLLAGTDESPGQMITTPKGNVKVYRGMASKEAQREWKGSVASREGISTHIPYKGSVRTTLEELKIGIRSGFSYSGAKDLTQLQERATFIQQTSASCKESNTHILEGK